MKKIKLLAPTMMLSLISIAAAAADNYTCPTADEVMSNASKNQGFVNLQVPFSKSTLTGYLDPSLSAGGSYVFTSASIPVTTAPNPAVYCTYYAQEKEPAPRSLTAVTDYSYATAQGSWVTSGSFATCESNDSAACVFTLANTTP